MHWFPLQDSVLVTHPWLQSAKYFYSTVFLFHFIGFATLSLGRISVPLTFSISPQVLWRRARWRNMSKQVNFRVTPGASVHHPLVTNTNTKYKWPEDDGDLKSVSILKTLTWIMRRDISRINSLWHSWLGLSQRYRRDTNTSTKVHSALKSMKEFRLRQHLTNTVQNSYIFPENEILPQKPIFIPGAIGCVLIFWKCENAWTLQTVTDIIGCLAWLKKYEHLGVFDTGDLWTLTICTSHIHSLLVCSSRILIVKNKVKIDTVCGVHRVQWVQIQVDNLDTSDNTEEDNSHTVMIVMMIINLVIMMTAMLSPPGCNQLSGTTLQSWEGMLHCRAGRLAAWLTVQHQHHPFVKPMLSFLPICLFFLLFCLFMLLAQRKCKSWKEFRWRLPPCDPKRSPTCCWERVSSGFPGKPHPIFWDVFRRVQEFARWDLRVKSSLSETTACIFIKCFFWLLSGHGKYVENLCYHRNLGTAPT